MVHLPRMFRKAALALATTTCCLVSVTANAEGPAVSTANASKSSTRDIASEMTSLYNNMVDMCPYDSSSDPDPDRPAFLCSGIMIRGATNDTADPPKFYVWSEAPSTTQGTGPDHTGQGGVSFSWIRRQTTFSGLPASGYTLFPLFGPYNAHDSSKIVLKVLCAFAMDAWTDERRDAGCGIAEDPKTNKVIPGGDVCQDQNILTSDQWIQHYRNPPSGVPPYRYECGPDTWTSVSRNGKLRNGQAAYQLFMLPRLALATIYDPKGTFAVRNELRIQEWPVDTPPAALAIQSFYYTKGSASGKADAQKSQTYYYKLTNRFVPVIQITTPSQYGADFEFAQLAGDQVVPVPK